MVGYGANLPEEDIIDSVMDHSAYHRIGKQGLKHRLNAFFDNVGIILARLDILEIDICIFVKQLRVGNLISQLPLCVHYVVVGLAC